MFDELFECTKKVNEKVNEEDLAKLIPLVRKPLEQEFAGRRLEDAADDVAEGMLRNFPDILEDEELLSDPERWGEFVWDCAAREGY